MASDHDVVDAPPGTLGRLVSALELIASAHASRAREEAGKDASRVLGGVVLLLLAIFFCVPVVLLVDAALVLYLVERGTFSLPAALGAVAAGNALVVLALGLRARSQLEAPVLVETRATLKRAAIVIRGS